MPLMARQERGGGGGGVEIQLHPCLTPGGWSTICPGSFTTGKYPAPIVQEAGWATVPVWTGVENPTFTGIPTPNRPARSESLYRYAMRLISHLLVDHLQTDCPILRPSVPLVVCTGLSFELLLLYSLLIRFKLLLTILLTVPQPRG
jgi:hypothetical protein